MASPGLLTAQSARIKQARRLATRAFRRKTGRFLVEGPQAVREALAADPSGVLEVFVTEAARERYADLAAAARAAGAPVDLVDGPTMAELAGTVHPQGLLAVCATRDVPLARVLESRPRLVAFLAQVRDPGNLGTVVRCADADGADAVLVSSDSVDVHNPKAVR